MVNKDESKPKSMTTSVSLSDDDYEWCKRHNFKLSGILQDAIKKLREEWKEGHPEEGEQK